MAQRFAIALVILAAGLGWGSRATEAAPSEDVVTARASGAASVGSQVVIGPDEYRPTTLTVPVGTTVTWINRDGEVHTATAPVDQRFTRPFGSPPLRPGQAFSYRFAAPGTYPYFDAFDLRLSGTIVVR